MVDLVKVYQASEKPRSSSNTRQLDVACTHVWSRLQPEKSGLTAAETDGDPHLYEGEYAASIVEGPMGRTIIRFAGCKNEDSGFYSYTDRDQKRDKDLMRLRDTLAAALRSQLGDRIETPDTPENQGGYGGDPRHVFSTLRHNDKSPKAIIINPVPNSDNALDFKTAVSEAGKALQRVTLERYRQNPKNLSITQSELDNLRPPEHRYLAIQDGKHSERIIDPLKDDYRAPKGSKQQQAVVGSHTERLSTDRTKTPTEVIQDWARRGSITGPNGAPIDQTQIDTLIAQLKELGMGSPVR